MQHLLNLFAAIALLVWGTHTVRTGVLRVLGEDLRRVLKQSTDNQLTAMLAGLGVTGLIQSSTATCLIASSFVGQGLIATGAGLAVMLGADMGTSLMAVVFSFDLSWLSPLLIVIGVILFTSRQATTAGRVGRVMIGLGLITLALQLIVSATRPMTQSPLVQSLLTALPNEVLLGHRRRRCADDLFLFESGHRAADGRPGRLGHSPADGGARTGPGANLGSGILAVLSTARNGPAERRVPIGNLIFKGIGCALMLVLMPYVPAVLKGVAPYMPSPLSQVVSFHFLFNIVLGLLFIGFTRTLGARLDRWLPVPLKKGPVNRPQHLDPTALATPSLAISCAAREALHQADVVETMLRGVVTVIRTNDLTLAGQLRASDDTVDELYSAIKFYLTQISREALSEREGRRWADIVSFTINMEQIGDTIERVLQDIEDKKIRPGRSFSDAGMAEICHMHERLVSNLRLGMSVFLDGQIEDAQKLLQEKAHFRDLEREYASTHLSRLQDNTPESIGTSSLHIDLISDLKRINSHICSIAYPILEAAGALTKTRLREPEAAV
jgi:phosphate:Na+ symporter